MQKEVGTFLRRHGISVGHLGKNVRQVALRSSSYGLRAAASGKLVYLGDNQK